MTIHAVLVRKLLVAMSTFERFLTGMYSLVSCQMPSDLLPDERFVSFSSLLLGEFSIKIKYKIETQELTRKINPKIRG